MEFNHSINFVINTYDLIHPSFHCMLLCHISTVLLDNTPHKIGRRFMRHGGSTLGFAPSTDLL